MKTFKSLNAATKHAKGGLLWSICVEGKTLYIAGDITSTSTVALLHNGKPQPREDIDWVGGSWAYVGHVSARHLARLGNANWAERTPQSGPGRESFEELVIPAESKTALKCAVVGVETVRG